ncbi:MAG: hypothetical protein AAF411_17035 [Myxococcota bacterium]
MPRRALVEIGASLGVLQLTDTAGSAGAALMLDPVVVAPLHTWGEGRTHNRFEFLLGLDGLLYLKGEALGGLFAWGGFGTSFGAYDWAFRLRVAYGGGFLQQDNGFIRSAAAIRGSIGLRLGRWISDVELRQTLAGRQTISVVSIRLAYEL